MIGGCLVMAMSSANWGGTGGVSVSTLLDPET